MTEDNVRQGELLAMIDGDGGHGQEAGGHSDELSAASTPVISGDVTFSKNEICSVLRLQSLLVQFSHPQVCADFINSKFNWTINPTILSRIDDLRCLLFPRWTGASSMGNDPSQRKLLAARHLRSMISRENSLLVLPGEDAEKSLTYENWFVLLNSIASDAYWSAVVADDRCMHILASESQSSDGGSKTRVHNSSSQFLGSASAVKMERGTVSQSSESESGSSSSSESDQWQNKRT